MKFILGTKQGMTQIFRADGTVVPVTRIQAGPCVVTQVKTVDKDRINSVQIGFGKQKSFRLNQAVKGHLKNINWDNNLTVRLMKDFATNNEENLKRGDIFTVKIFTPGEKVQVVGTSKGRGFQGVVKRHGFAGGPASHGHKDNLRMPGSIGATGPQRVFKGVRMAGHMGDDRVTIKNLEVVDINSETNELLIKGAVPGSRGGLLLISTPDGKIEIEQINQPPEVVTETIADAPVTESEKVDTDTETEVENSSAPLSEEEVVPDTEEKKD